MTVTQETTKQRVLKMLTERGLWEDEAEQVLERAKPQLETGGYRVTWDRPADEYPQPLYAVFLMILKREALKYIDETRPMHFARPMFTENPEAEIDRLTAALAGQP